MFEGLLFFPITPFDAHGDVDHDALAAHIDRGVNAGAGGVFVACGTGEFNALEPVEYGRIVRTAIAATAGRVPVFSGAGGSVRTARTFADAAVEAGVDGLLLLPPYLTESSGAGLEAYVRAATTPELPTIVYHRANARFTEESAVAIARLPQVIGLKDGVGDIELMSRIVRAVRDDLAETGTPFHFFNGLPTAEVTQRAYRAIGVPLYSSAAFAFVPEIALAYFHALEVGDERTISVLDREFYHPLVRLRDQGKGYAVSLVKAGVELQGHPTGGLRPPLTPLAPEHVAALRRIIEAGRAALSLAVA